jgi:hypothetical protein
MDASNEDDDLSMFQKEIKRFRTEIARSRGAIEDGALIELEPRGGDEDTGEEDATRTNSQLHDELENALLRQVELKELARVKKVQRDAVASGMVETPSLVLQECPLCMEPLASGFSAARFRYYCCGA